MTERGGEISRRASNGHEAVDQLREYLAMVGRNKYHPSSNPNGIIDMARGINKVSMKVLHEYLLRNNLALDCEKHLEKPLNINIENELKQNVASYYNMLWSASENMVQPDQIVVGNGVSSYTDSLAFALFDPGDVVIMQTPIYSSVKYILKLRAQVEVKEWNTEFQDERGNVFYSLDADSFESCILEAEKEGHRVKGFFLINPNNPTGEFYSKDVIEPLLKVCARYKIHFIVDEIFAHPILTPKEKFCSVLSIENLPDPNRTHMLFGMNKVFGLAGLRIGFIWTKNENLLNALNKMNIFKCVNDYTKEITSLIIKDHKWLREEYFPSNSIVMQDLMDRARSSLHKMGAKVHPSAVGVFLWVNFGEFLQPYTKEEEKKLFDDLLSFGVCFNPGFMMDTKTLGWYRVNVAQTPEILEEGLNRLQKVLENKKQKINELK